MMAILGIVWGALKSPLASYIGIAASIALGLWLIMVEAKLGEAHGQLDKVTADWMRAVADLTTCHGNTATLQAALDEQSAKTQAIADAGAQNKADAQAAIDKLTAAQKGTRSLASTILAMKPQENECKAAYDILGRVGR